MATELLKKAEIALLKKDWPLVHALAQELITAGIEPDWGFYFLGMAEKARGQIQPALKAFQRAVKINKNNIDAVLQASEIQQRMGQQSEAIKAVRRALRVEELSVESLNKAGNILSRAGLHAEACPVFDRAYSADGENLTSQINLAGAKAKTGALEDARNLYQNILNILPAHQRLHYELSKLGKVQDKTHIEQMERLLTESAEDDNKNIFLLFALGKEYEDLQEWDTAFGFYSRGNAAAAQISRRQGYNVQSDISVLKAIKEHFNFDSSTKGRKISTQKSQPIFIVGLPRSGTTLLEKIITGHSQIESIDESFFLENAVKNYCKVGPRQSLNPEHIKDLARGRDTAQICENYLKWTEYRRHQKPYFVEKYPMNFQYLGLIARHMPHAKFLFMTREKLDVCFALYKQPHFRFSFELSGLRRYHAAFAELTDHWRDVLGDRICSVAYEDLVNKPEPTTRAVMKFLNLDYFPELLDFHKRREVSASASSAQIREKIYSSSIARWRKFERHLNDLIGSGK